MFILKKGKFYKTAFFFKTVNKTALLTVCFYHCDKIYVQTKFNFDRTAYSYREERVYLLLLLYNVCTKKGESFAEWSFHEFMKICSEQLLIICVCFFYTFLDLY